MEFINAISRKLFADVQIPGVDFAALAKQVDSFCAAHINNVVEFLDQHPGIAMALSPTTVLRQCAQKHAAQQIGMWVSVKAETAPDTVVIAAVVDEVRRPSELL